MVKTKMRFMKNFGNNQKVIENVYDLKIVSYRELYLTTKLSFMENVGDNLKVFHGDF